MIKTDDAHYVEYLAATGARRIIAEHGADAAVYKCIHSLFVINKWHATTNVEMVESFRLLAEQGRDVGNSLSGVFYGVRQEDAKLRDAAVAALWSMLRSDHAGSEDIWRRDSVQLVYRFKVKGDDEQTKLSIAGLLHELLTRKPEMAETLKEHIAKLKIKIPKRPKTESAKELMELGERLGLK